MKSVVKIYDKGKGKKKSRLLQQFILALFIAKVKVVILHKGETQSHITKQLLTSVSVDIRIYQPSEVIFTSASMNITF